MSSAARASVYPPPAVYLPIDGLNASLDDALAEIREIESRRMDGIGRPRPDAPELEQRQRLQDAKDFVIHAQALVYAYAKGPKA